MIESKESTSRLPTPLPQLATRPVLSAIAALSLLLTATSNQYGYHRDELYFRLLKPSWGYVDQPPLTPFLARLTRHVSEAPWAMHLPATVFTATSVYVLVLVTREVGGGRTAQSLCAWGYAFAALPLIMGHVLLTSTVDLPVWPALLLFVLRAQLRKEPRWWLAAGLLVGVSTYNKLLVVVVLVALAAGLLAVGPRLVLWSRHVLAGAAIALVVGAPNLIYQAVNGWPQLSVGRALADDNAGSVHVLVVPFLFIILGPPLVPIWVAGWLRLWRIRSLRFVAVAFPVLVVLVFAMGSQFYYTFGLLAVLFAVGCVPAAEWMIGWRTRLVAAGVAANAAVSIVLGLPVIPLSSLGSTPVPGINQVARDTIGWPAYAQEVSAVYDGLPTSQRAHAVVYASNYGEAGAVDRYAHRLPVYSAHNDLYHSGRPPESATTAVFVGGEYDRAPALFRSCRVAGHLDDGVGVDNEEQHEPIGVCTEPIGGWSTIWPRLKHLG